MVSKDLYNGSNYDDVIDLCERALEIAQTITYDLGEAESYFLLARANNKLNNSATALEFFNNAQLIFQKQKKNR